jgi:hypothetical protein
MVHKPHNLEKNEGTVPVNALSQTANTLHPHKAIFSDPTEATAKNRNHYFRDDSEDRSGSVPENPLLSTYNALSTGSPSPSPTLHWARRGQTSTYVLQIRHESEGVRNSTIETVVAK